MFLKIVFLTILIILQDTLGNPSNCHVTIDISDGTVNGTDIIKDGLTFTENDYYTDNDQVTWGCICQVKICIRRCCSSDEALQPQINGSVDCSASESVNTTEDVESVVGVSIAQYHIISVPARNVCVEGEVQLYVEEDFEVDTSGNLTWENEKFGFENYCASRYNGVSVALVCVVADSSTNALIYCFGKCLLRKVFTPPGDQMVQLSPFNVT